MKVRISRQDTGWRVGREGRHGEREGRGKKGGVERGGEGGVVP